MKARNAAILSLIAWTAVIVLMASQAVVLGERLSYDETAFDLGRSLDPALGQAMEFFDLSNYRDRDRVLLYVYNTLNVGNLLEFEVFKALAEKPHLVATALIKGNAVRDRPVPR